MSLKERLEEIYDTVKRECHLTDDNCRCPICAALCDLKEIIDGMDTAN